MDIYFTTDCYPDPCSGHGMCYNTLGGYTCRCQTGYEGKDCNQGKLLIDWLIGV